jgi:hypothetical protein
MNIDKFWTKGTSGLANLHTLIYIIYCDFKGASDGRDYFEIPLILFPPLPLARVRNFLYPSFPGLRPVKTLQSHPSHKLRALQGRILPGVVGRTIRGQRSQPKIVNFFLTTLRNTPETHSRQSLTKLIKKLKGASIYAIMITIMCFLYVFSGTLGLQ